MDLRYAFRTLRNAPTFTAVVILTLALGIGANTAIFSRTDQVLLRLLPVKDADRLVLFENPGAFAGRQFNSNTFSYPMYRDFRDRNAVFSGIVARFPTPLTLMANGQAERISGELVSGNYFDVLGVRAVVGRSLTPDDDRVPGAHPVVSGARFFNRQQEEISAATIYVRARKDATAVASAVRQAAQRVDPILPIVAAAAGYLPARRATRVDPMLALRYE